MPETLAYFSLFVGVTGLLIAVGTAIARLPDKLVIRLILFGIALILIMLAIGVFAAIGK